MFLRSDYLTKSVNLALKKVDYLDITRKVCSILGIDVSDLHDLGEMLERLQTWTEKTVYFTSTQKDIIDNVKQIVQDIHKRENKRKILQKIGKFENDVYFDRCFE
jgi:hypothetical protein